MDIEERKKMYDDAVKNVDDVAKVIIDASPIKKGDRVLIKRGESRGHVKRVSFSKFSGEYLYDVVLTKKDWSVRAVEKIEKGVDERYIELSH